MNIQHQTHTNLTNDLRILPVHLHDFLFSEVLTEGVVMLQHAILHNNPLMLLKFRRERQQTNKLARSAQVAQDSKAEVQVAEAEFAGNLGDGDLRANLVLDEVGLVTAVEFVLDEQLGVGVRAAHVAGAEAATSACRPVRGSAMEAGCRGWVRRLDRS